MCDFNSITSNDLNIYCHNLGGMKRVWEKFLGNLAIGTFDVVVLVETKLEVPAKKMTSDKLPEAENMKYRLEYHQSELHNGGILIAVKPV